VSVESRELSPALGVDVRGLDPRRSRALRHGGLAALAALWGCATAGGFELREDVAFDGPEGTGLLVLAPRPDAVELLDARGDRLGSYALEHEVLRIRDRHGNELGFVRPAAAAPGLELRALPDGALRFRVAREPDGNLRLEDGSGRALAKLTRRDGGYQIEGPNAEPLGSVEVRPGEISLRGTDGKTLLSTRHAIPAEGVACFAFDPVPLELQGACALAVLHWRAAAGSGDGL
jgi:hypothetical protein